MNGTWILVMVFKIAAGTYGVGFSQQPGTDAAVEFPTYQACMTAGKERLEHRPKYVIDAKVMCTDMAPGRQEKPT
jgi:hypothetical protein